MLKILTLVLTLISTQALASYVPNVVTNSASKDKVERARIAKGSGTCSVTSQSGTWITAATHNATGKCTLTITGFSAAPACVAVIEAASGYIFHDTTPTSTTLIFLSRNGSGTDADDNYSLICAGPR